MDPKLFDQLHKTYQSDGATQAIDQLCKTLEEQKDFGNLFYALLMKRRVELGVSPLPTSPATELPTEVHEPYENAIRESAERIGKLFLDDGKILQAWNYYRLLGENEPVMAALEAYEPDDSEECQEIIQLAFHQGVHPRKGFDWVLDRYGICSAITLMGSNLNGPEFAFGPDARDHCIKNLVRALHEQLVERLKNDIEQHDGAQPETDSVPQLIEGRDWLFGDDNYHVDISHLASVVQMAIHLSECEERNLARELCAYGRGLSSQFQQPGDPPFDDTYKDYGIYLDTLAGHDSDKGIAHFRAKADNHDPDYPINSAAEALVNLLLRVERNAEALAAARQYLNNVEERDLACPGIADLCRQVEDYHALAEVSRERGDPVHFVAGLIDGNASK